MVVPDRSPPGNPTRPQNAPGDGQKGIGGCSWVCSVSGMPNEEPLRSLIREVPDWPTPGVSFKDITPLLADPKAFDDAVERLARSFADREVTHVVGIEARGFVLAAPIALRLGVGFVPARKPGKLPWTTRVEPYELEYGTDELQMHADAVVPGDRALIVDDVLATGGTASAAVRLVESAGVEVVGIGFLLELGFLGGAEKLPADRHVSLLTYDS